MQQHLMNQPTWKKYVPVKVDHLPMDRGEKILKSLKFHHLNVIYGDKF